MLRACAGIDAVIHLTDEPRGLPEIAVHSFRSNALRTFVAINAAQRSGVAALPVRLDHQCIRHLLLTAERQACALWDTAAGRGSPAGSGRDPCSLSKLVNEETCAAYHQAYGMTAIASRFAGVWSPTRYAWAREAGLPPTTAWSDDLHQWVHVADIARGRRWKRTTWKALGYLLSERGIPAVRNRPWR